MRRSVSILGCCCKVVAIRLSEVILSPVFCTCENLVSPVLVSLVPESNLSTGASSVEGQQGGEGPEAKGG